MLNRRTFLMSTGAAGGSFLALNSLAAQSSMEAPPKEMLNVAFVGVGNQGISLLTRLLTWNLARVVAVCDTNQGSFGYREPNHFYGREPAADLVNEHYKKLGIASDCKAYADFRDVLADASIDAVFLVVPDHWHATMSVLAAAAGKHVYCEKPLTLTIAEGQQMIDAVNKYGITLQTGSQERSNPISKFVCELVKAGGIGKVHRVLTTIGFNNKDSPPPGWQPDPVPQTFNYNMWLGPAPEAPYHHDRCLYRFRFNYDYSGGQITNFGAHCNDMAHWGLGMDRSGPHKIECLEAEFPVAGSLFNTALKSTFRCEYENGVELICASGSPSVQTRFEGDDGWILTGYGETTASRPELLKGLPNYDKRKQIDPHSLHMKDFLEAIIEKRSPVAPVEVGHASATLCHLANIAIRCFPTHGRELLTWDPVNQTFPNHPDCNAEMSRPQRENWG